MMELTSSLPPQLHSAFSFANTPPNQGRIGVCVVHFSSDGKLLAYGDECGNVSFYGIALVVIFLVGFFFLRSLFVFFFACFFSFAFLSSCVKTI